MSPSDIKSDESKTRDKFNFSDTRAFAQKTLVGTDIFPVDTIELKH